MYDNHVWRFNARSGVVINGKFEGINRNLVNYEIILDFAGFSIHFIKETKKRLMIYYFQRKTVTNFSLVVEKNSRIFKYSKWPNTQILNSVTSKPTENATTVLPQN